MTQLIDDSATLVQLIAKTSFKYSAKGRFSLASGELSNYYIDLKMGLSYPLIRKRIGLEILRRIEGARVDVVGGMELGAYPIASAVSDACFSKTGKTLRSFVVRKRPKKHGLRKWIEGVVEKGDRALIVDDVVTTGQSTLTAVKILRESEVEIVKVVTVVDRQEGAADAFAEANVPFEWLLTTADLRSATQGEPLTASVGR